MKPFTRTALVSVSALAFAAPVLAVTGEEVLQNACAACHVQHEDGRWERIDAARKTPEGWDMTVTRMMRNHGVALEPEERAAIVRHLSDTRGLSLAETEERRYILEREPVAWDDLAGDVDGAGGVGASPEAVRELTRRIDAALREATINLEQWEDAPLVEWAQAIYAAEFQVDGTNGGAGAVDASGPGSRVGAAVGREPGGMGTSEPRGVPAAYDAPATRNAPAARIARVREAAETLARLRRSGDTSWTAVARDVSRHCRLLDQLRLQPDDLRATPRASAAVVWTLRQLAYFVVGAPLAAVGVATFYLPYRLTGIIEAASRPDLDRRSTYKALYGALLHLAWILALSAAAGWWLGWRVCIGAVVGLVLLGILTLSIRERWTDALANARRHLLLRGRRTLHERLRVRQREIAERLRALRAEVVDIVAEAAGDAAGPAVSARSTAPSSDGATASSMVGAPEQGVNR